MSKQVQVGSFDFGEVCIDAGAQVVDHVFQYRNTTDHDLEVVKIAATCGCVKAAMTPQRLRPGEAADLFMSTEVSGVGVVEQSSVVLLSDGTSLRVSERALGVRTTRLMVIPRRVRVAPLARQFTIELYVVDRRGIAEIGLPGVTISGMPVEARFTDWEVIERFDQAAGRPLRQVATLEIPTAQLGASGPVTIEIKTVSGLKSEVVVDLIPGVS